MTHSHAFLAGGTERPARPLPAVSRILLWFCVWLSVSLAGLFLVALPVAGRSTLLHHAAEVKPYAVAYQPVSTASTSDAQPTAEHLIVFLGDSSVAQPPWAAKDSPAIPALLRDALRESASRGASARVVDWSFAGARLFHYYCLLFEAEKFSPSLIVIPINRRGLGPIADEWSEKFAFRELSSLVPLAERSSPMGAAVMRVEGVGSSRQRFSAIHRPVLYVAGMKNWILSPFRAEPGPAPQLKTLQALPPGEHIIERYTDERLFTQYPCVVAADSPPMTALRAIVEAAERHGTAVLFYTTPIHLDEMRRRPRFEAATFAASTESIVATATSNATACLDLSDLLREDDFLDNYEHYTPDGNRAIAMALAPEVSRLLATIPSPAQSVPILAAAAD